ncbi:MAG: MFS transporter [Bacteroidota bacterium]|nr:MFS transporter [Bacteroidota bacterium]
MNNNHDPLGALKIHDFRVFVTARFFLTFSLQVQNVVLGWQVYQITKDPLSLGFLGLAEAVPAISVALFGGHLADTFNRKKVIIFISFILLVCSAGLFFNAGDLHFNQVDSKVNVIYLMVFLSGIARGLLGPSIFALWPTLIKNKEVFSNAVTWNSTIWQISSTLGPAIGGLLIAPLGIQGSYLLDFILMGISVVFFMQINFKPAPKVELVGGFWSNLLNGAKFVLEQKVLLSALSLDLFAVLFGGVSALLPVFAQEVLHVGSFEYGLLKSGMGIGAIIAAITLAFYPIRKRAGIFMLASVACFGVCMIGFAFSTLFIVSLLLLVVGGYFDGISVVIRATLTQTYTPDHMKGRVSAINNIFIGSSNEIGAFESGLAAKLMGLIPSVIFGGITSIGVVIATALASPRLRKLNF